MTETPDSEDREFELPEKPAAAYTRPMASVTRNVREIQGGEKQSLEQLLGYPLRDDQKVFIMVYTESLELDEDTRAQALADLKAFATKAHKHAKEQGYSDEEIDAAIDQTAADVRRRKRL